MNQNTLRPVSETPDMIIPLGDGTRLSARVWMPQDASADPVPAILEYLPYRKRDGTCARDALTHPWFAGRGYACLRVDMRGNGDSEGIMEDEYTEQELSDAVEVITWIAQQPWCSGRVGMMGISWGGFNSLQVAARQPEPLKAVITLCSTVDRFNDDIHYKGGCLLNENLGWGATMWSYSSRAPDPALRPDWREIWMQRLEAEPFLPRVWLGHQTRDEYWKHGSVCESYDTIKAKVLAVGGWGDAYKNAVPQLVENLPGAKGIIGPWVHKYPHFAVPEPRIGFLQEALRWWDRWLKGQNTGVEEDPDLRLYNMDGVRPATWYAERPGTWMGDPGSLQKTFHFAGNTLASSAAPCEVVVCSPADTGSEGGEYCAIWLGPELPGDQRSDDARSACFDSAPLDAAITITGAPEIELTLSSDQPLANLAVRLCHVHPDGASTRITWGVLNIAAGLGRELVPGQTETLRLSLDHIAYTIPEGHVLRVAVSTAYWPMIWPTPALATVTIHAGSVELSLVTGHSAVQFPEPASAQPWETETLREQTHVRRRETDMVSGAVSLVIEDDFGKLRDLDHGLVTGSHARELWRIHPDDPLCAYGSCHWSDEMERDDIKLRTETRCEMWSDATDFHLSARVEAFENGILIFEKDISDVIARVRM